MAPLANVASQKIGLEAKFVSPSVTKFFDDTLILQGQG